MTDTTLQQEAPASNSGRSLKFKVSMWILALVLISAAWFIFLAIAAPARLEFSSGRAAMLASAPPLLFTFFCWTAVQRHSVPDTQRAAPAADAPAAPAEPPMPGARFRIGAWSALTPHGNAIETLVGSKARTKVFKPDKAIPHPSGYPAHAAMIHTLKLEAMGHAAGTRLRAVRVMTMLGAVLDDLHAQQATLADTIEGPVNVYWLVPDALMTGDDAQGELFANAWNRSAWRKGSYLLQMIPAGDASAFTVLSALQNGIEQSAIPYTVIVAADSLLDREELAPALALGHVFSHTSPQGLIPSEAAAGVLLFNPCKTADDWWADAAILGPVKTVTRDADQDALRAAMSAALAASGKDTADIATVVSDSDHRTQASLEAIGAMRHVLAGLDPLEHRISPMEHAGTFGAAADLVHLALAVELAGENPALALSTGSGQCASVVVLPA